MTGIFWAIRSAQVDPVETGWLLTVEVLYLVALFVCLPAMAASLRRARFLALQSQKTGEISDELRETIADRGPLVFGTLMLLLIALMTALAVTQPTNNPNQLLRATSNTRSEIFRSAQT